MQLIDAWKLSHVKLASGVAFATFPWLTILLEIGISITMILEPAVGALLGLGLHAFIALTPPPNNAAAYGVVCATRYFWLAPFAVTRAWRNAVDYAEFAVHASVGAIFLAVTVRRPSSFYVKDSDGHFGWSSTAAPSSTPDGFSFASLLQSEREEDEQSQLPPFFASVDWAAGMFGVLASLITRATILQWSPDRRDSATKKREGIVTIVAESSAPAVFWISVMAMAAYAFGAVLFGFTDPGGPNMHAGLRVVGGSNHVLKVPTGLLQRWYLHDPTSVFSGGLVRVEECSSRYVNAIHPGDLTPVLSKGAKDLLHEYRHNGKTWNSAVANVVGEGALPIFSKDKKSLRLKDKERLDYHRASLPSSQKDEGLLKNISSITKGTVGALKSIFGDRRDDGRIPRPLTDRYTVPAYELARVLKNARRHHNDQPFRVVYARLDGPMGDENWRRHSVSKLIRLDVDATGTNCTVLDHLDPKHDPISRVSSSQDPPPKHPSHPPNAHRPDATSCAPEDFLDGRTWAFSLINILGAKFQTWHSYPVVPRLTLRRYERHSDELPCYGA